MGGRSIRRAAIGLAALGLLVVLAAPPHAIAREDGADGNFEKRTSSHFVLWQDVDIDERHGIYGSRRFEQDVLATLEAAYADLDAMLGLRPRRPITVVIYDPDDFQARFSGLFRFPAAGFYGGTIHVRGGTALDARLARVLRHELVHAGFDSVAPSLVLPAWLNEGLAEWFEARTLGKRSLNSQEAAFLASAARNGGLYPLSQLWTFSFGHLGPGAARLAYLQSYAFMDYLARTHSEQSLRELSVELLRTGQLERAVKRVFRAELGRLEQRFVAAYSGGARR